MWEEQFYKGGRGIVLSEKESKGAVRDQSNRYPLKMLCQSMTNNQAGKNLIEIAVRFNVAT